MVRNFNITKVSIVETKGTKNCSFRSMHPIIELKHFNDSEDSESSDVLVNSIKRAAFDQNQHFTVLDLPHMAYEEIIWFTVEKNYFFFAFFQV
jgi:hypothetical protein